MTKGVVQEDIMSEFIQGVVFIGALAFGGLTYCWTAWAVQRLAAGKKVVPLLGDRFPSPNKEEQS